MGETSVKISRRKLVTEVAISGMMTIQEAGALRDGLQKAFALGKPVRIAVAGVTDVDLTGLQLLCSAHRTAIARGVDLSVTGSGSEPFNAVATMAGMVRRAGCVQDLGGTCVWMEARLKGDSRP